MAETTGRRERVLELAGGRHLGVAEYGDPAARPLLYFHGTPGSRLDVELWGGDLMARKLAVHILAPDRPGMGRSDFVPGRRMSDWPADVVALADALGLDRFPVIGYSGGVPYAAACGMGLQDRVSSAALVACVNHSRPDLEEGIDENTMRFKALAKDRPLLSRLLIRTAMGLTARVAPNRFIKNMLSTLNPADQAVMERPEAQRAFIDTVLEGLRHGAHGAQYELSLMVSPWDFELGPTSVPVHIWQGTEDNIGARPAMAEFVQEQIPGSELTLYPEGHVSIMANRLEEILGECSSA